MELEKLVNIDGLTQVANRRCKSHRSWLSKRISPSIMLSNRA